RSPADFQPKPTGRRRKGVQRQDIDSRPVRQESGRAVGTHASGRCASRKRGMKGCGRLPPLPTACKAAETPLKLNLNLTRC
uniref:hypothetical protein n=3 Tax=Erwinia amylovora TaxID=552 RepID=UPI001965755E